MTKHRLNASNAPNLSSTSHPNTSNLGSSSTSVTYTEPPTIKAEAFARNQAKKQEAIKLFEQAKYNRKYGDFASQEEKDEYLENRILYGWWKNYTMHVVEDLVQFRGVDDRYDFWRFYIVNLGVILAIIVIYLFLGTILLSYYPSALSLETISSSKASWEGVYSFIYIGSFIAIGIWNILALFSAVIRRLHDINLSGWWVLSYLIIGIGILLAFKATVYENNRYFYQQYLIDKDREEQRKYWDDN